MVKTKKAFWAALLCIALALHLLTAAILGLSALRAATAEPTPSTAATTQPATLPPPEENPLTPMDFAYEGGYMTCLSAPSVLGIDVSSHQKTVDWQQVAAAGVEFVMIRVGYRGTEQGGIFPDDYAQQNYAGARAAGLEVGAYFFSQAISPEEARQEARFAMEQVAGWELSYPLVYDWEYVDEQSRTAGVDARLLTDCTKAFCDEVAAAGYDPMVYFNPSQSRKQMYMQELTDYGFWLAMYSDEMTYEYRVDMWQYTCRGAVPGITGNVDINLYFPR